MDLMQGILTRRSVRKYQDKKIEKTVLEKIIKAAQFSPSAHNKQPWEFLVIEDKETMASLRQIQPWTSFAKDAACVILVCGNENEAFSRDKDDEKWSYADVDCAIATQSLMLAAWSEGIGSCYCGVAPMPKIIDTLREKFALPAHIRPFALVPLGYPDETPKQPQDRYKTEKIHWGQW